MPSVEERARVAVGPKYPDEQYHVYGVFDDSMAPTEKGCGRGRDSVTISLLDKVRLNMRRSLMEPEKSSPAVLAGVTPFQPRRRVEKEDVDKEETANVADIDETLDPSTNAVRTDDEDEPV